MVYEQENVFREKGGQCCYHMALEELLPLVRKIQDKKRTYEDVLALYEWCRKRNEMQYVVLAQYVVRALEMMVEQPQEKELEQLDGETARKGVQRDARIQQLVEKFIKIRWITRINLMKVRLQQVMERL